MFASIYFIHRMITYVPTYSGYKYGELNMVTVALGILMIVLSIKTKLGEKVQILVDRVEDFRSGQGSAREGYSQQSQVRVTQPLSNQYAQSSGGMMVTGGIAQCCGLFLGELERVVSVSGGCVNSSHSAAPGSPPHLQYC